MGKPEFDSSQPFESADAKPDFDPNQPFEKSAAPMGTVERYGRAALKALPGAGMILGEVGGIASAPVTGPAGPLAGPLVGAAAGKAAKNYLEEKLFDEKKTTTQKIAEPIQEAGETAALAMLPVEKALKMVAESPTGQAIGKGISKTYGAAADYFSGKAAKLAEQATGATGKQVLDNFADDAGRELIDRGIVRFGDTQAKVAERARAAMDTSNKAIDSSLEALDKKGAVVNTNQIYQKIMDRAKELGKSSATQDLAVQMEKQADNLVKSAEANGWETNFPVSKGELEKREFRRQAGDWRKPDSNEVGKEMYQIWRGAVEDAATKADPHLADAFKEAKETYGLMSPIAEAAERRAAVTNQHQGVGLLDLESMRTGAEAGTAIGYAVGGSTGAAIGAGTGAVVAPFARRFVAPRISSSGSASVEAVGNALRAIPKYAEQAVKDPQLFKASVQTYIDQNVDERGLKGPSRWAADGYDKLLEHGADLDLLGKAKADPKLKNILIEASEEKPGSKVMDKILDKLKSKAGSK